MDRYKKKPEPPVVQKLSATHWKLSSLADKTVKAMVIYDADRILRIVPGRELDLDITTYPNAKIGVTAISRTNNESKLVTLE